MASIFPSMSSIMCRAVVGLGFPEVFPEGAAMGTRAARMTARQMEWSGQRIPTVSSPAVTTSGTAGFRRRTMVSGPGQKRLASFRAVSGTSSQYHSSQEGSGMWRMRGLSWGRPLARKMSSTALGFRPLAPRP